MRTRWIFCVNLCRYCGHFHLIGPGPGGDRQNWGPAGGRRFMSLLMHHSHNTISVLYLKNIGIFQKYPKKDLSQV